ncbi:hypothetical protein NDU88_000645 [Pleurodeles waltl]|uniref:Uncharacterized protein n=1 Tax=Pleurodeles waltl TaxID=8319 RepID=A0AAV7VX74_PLEWA|nr:hypothetical protein NDU88_000645 [Pleurodeles waltl]
MGDGDKGPRPHWTVRLRTWLCGLSSRVGLLGRRVVSLQRRRSSLRAESVRRARSAVRSDRGPRYSCGLLHWVPEAEQGAGWLGGCCRLWGRSLGDRSAC